MSGFRALQTNKKTRAIELRAINPIEVPQKVADELFETVILPYLLQEYFDEMGAELDKRERMGDVIPFGVPR